MFTCEYSRECKGTLGGGPLERNVCLLYTRYCYCESSKSLEGDCGMDRVSRFRLLTPFQEGIHHKLLFLNSASKVANLIAVDILKYLY